MTAFLAVAALLVAGALLFILPPLMSRGSRSNVRRDDLNAAVYRDQLRELEADLAAGTLAADQYEKARAELEARVLQDVGAEEAEAQPAPRSRWTAIAAGIAVPLLAAVLYVAVGNPEGLSPQARSEGASHQLTEQQITEMVERLAVRLKENPDDAEGWTMLARAYSVLGRFQESAQAYAVATARIPNNAQLFADYADAAAMAQGRSLQGEPEKLIARALEIEPDNVKALALSGTAAFEKKDYARAAATWERLLKSVPPDSEISRAVSSSIAEARGLSGAGTQKSEAAAEATKAAPGAMLSGVVSLAPALASKVGPNDTVFIYARAAEGPRAPLAVLRKSARELPVQFTLDDSMSMAPSMKLSSFPKVIVAARISKSGNASPQAGDLQGASGAISNAASGVKIVIDTEVQ